MLRGKVIATTCDSASPISHGMTRVRVRDDIRLEYIITSELSWSSTRQPSRSVRQQLQWGPEKGKVQSIPADVVEADIMSGDIGLMGGL